MKCLFIYNPNSGKGKIKKYKNYVIKNLSKKFDSVDIIETMYSFHAQKIAEENIGKYDCYIISGGDGTLNEVINAIAEKDNAPIIGFIPTGTTNDVAHSLKIPINIKKAVKVILNGEIFTHDIFKVNDKYGIYVCCSGLISEVSYTTKQKEKKFWGKFAYFIEGAKKIFKSKPLNIKLTYNDVVLEKNCCLMLIVNSKYVATFKVNKHAVLNDGFVDVILVDSPKKTSFSMKSFLWAVKLFLFGINYSKKNKHITYLKLKDFNVEINNNSNINLDGECGMQGSFKFKSLNKGVKIFVPYGKKRNNK